MDEVSARDRAIYLVGYLAGQADREMNALLLRLARRIDCPFGERCACNPSDPSHLLN